MREKLTQMKAYLQPADMLLNAIHDAAELQKAVTLHCDAPHGTVRLQIEVYSQTWEYEFTVSDLWSSRCTLTISITGEAPEAERLLSHEFALIDYVLLDRTKIESSDMKAFDDSLSKQRKNIL